jgi:hypothetical protein
MNKRLLIILTLFGSVTLLFGSDNHRSIFDPTPSQPKPKNIKPTNKGTSIVSAFDQPRKTSLQQRREIVPKTGVPSVLPPAENSISSRRPAIRLASSSPGTAPKFAHIRIPITMDSINLEEDDDKTTTTQPLHKLEKSKYRSASALSFVTSASNSSKKSYKELAVLSSRKTLEGSAPTLRRSASTSPRRPVRELRKTPFSLDGSASATPSPRSILRASGTASRNSVDGVTPPVQFGPDDIRFFLKSEPTRAVSDGRHSSLI